MDDWTRLLATERHARIRAVLDEYRDETSLYLEPEIPANKLANLRSTTQIPATERVLGLIDGTVFGSAKNGILFGEDALHYHNSWTTSNDAHRGRRKLAYPELAQLELKKAWLEVRFSGGAIEVSGSSFSVDKMISLLSRLQTAITHGPSFETTSPLDGTYIAAHLVDRASLEPSNEHWPAGLQTNADASVVQLPLEHTWTLDIGKVVAAPAIVRDFVIIAIRNDVFAGPPQLVGLELTTGRRYWWRELPVVHWGNLVAADGRVLRKGGALWHAFDLETGEPRAIASSSLSRAVRDQLVLSEVAIHEPESYAAFAAELAPPEGIAGAPPLLAANRRRRIYAWPGEVSRAPSIRIVDERGTFDLAGARRGELLGHAMTERYLFLGTADDRLHVVDCEASPPAFVTTTQLPSKPEWLAIGSDHLVIAGGGWVRCYRGS